jgi:hypothetical protein
MAEGIYSDRRYFRVTVKLPARRTFWACSRTVRPNGWVVYTVCDEFGRANETDRREIIVVTLDDVIAEKPARMNLHYGELEVAKR